MRLRSNHVLDPVSKWQPTRRRPRGASAQPEQQPEQQPEPVTPLPARKGRPSKKGKGKNAPKVKRSVTLPSVSPQSSPLSPAVDMATPPGFYSSSPLSSPIDMATPPGFWSSSPPVLSPSSPRPASLLARLPPALATPLRALTTLVRGGPTPKDAANNKGSPELAQQETSTTTAATTRRLPFRVPRAFQWGSATELLSGRHPRGRRNPQPPKPLEARRRFPRGKPVLTIPKEESRKRTRSSEDETPMKRYKPAQPSTPTRSTSRPRVGSRTTYADRTRRRQAEMGGRIDRTIFRFPEYLAQQNADARSAPPPEYAEHQDQDTTATTNDNVPPGESSLPSDVPETPNQPGWGRWMFDKVTRRWTGLLGRSNAPHVENPSHANELVEAGRDQEHESSYLPAVPSSAPARSFAKSPIRGSPTPASRMPVTSRQIPPQAAAATKPRKRYNNYDLFGAGYSAEQRARWHVDVPPPSSESAPVTASISTTTIQSASPHPIPTQFQTPEPAKRKRKPSPDVIPNPPGCSYGLNEEYFMYDEEDWAAQEQTQPEPTLPKAAGLSSGSESRVSKKVRIERQPKVIDQDQVQYEIPGSYSDREGSRSTHIAAAPTKKASKKAAKKVSKTDTTEGASKDATKDQGRRLKKARDRAEQYKPKTPSRLRAAHRFSSSNNASSTHEESQFIRDLMYNSEDAVRRRRMRKTSLAEACPTGDLNNIIWPEFDTWTNRLWCFINEDVVDWTVLNDGKRKRKHRQDNFDAAFQERIVKRRADPNCDVTMWDYNKVTNLLM